jgi:hypothetical protein
VLAFTPNWDAAPAQETRWSALLDFRRRLAFRRLFVFSPYHRVGTQMKRYRLWFKEGVSRVEDLGVWEGETKREATAKCLAERNQTIPHCAGMLGLSEDQYLNEYVEAEE